ncbi:hypothetical protein CHU98_g8140 [Xylaria longipes]|nr:hypothetical protein CHU98_g8140 [Xylaria longipes]
MSDTATDQNQSVPAKDTEQSTAEAVSANDASKTENGTDSSTSQEQPQPGPKVLRSHFRGMPNQWEKNQKPKKDGE